jgi:hypothetical protein
MSATAVRLVPFVVLDIAAQALSSKSVNMDQHGPRSDPTSRPCGSVDIAVRHAHVDGLRAVNPFTACPYVRLFNACCFCRIPTKIAADLLSSVPLYMYLFPFWPELEA